MKRYKKSILGSIFYLIMLPLSMIQGFIETFSYIRLFFILLFIAILIYEFKFSFYIIKDQKFSLPMAETIDILKIKFDKFC